MSTFRGVVHEFPDITIDYFRHDGQRRPPLAALLSHIHSDHIAGLDNVHFGSPFIYCSAATKEILLRLEKYSARIAYAQGILEKRQPTYRHLKDLLRPLPLETSVRLELAPEYHIQVTLFNANHCPGAVMFLIEGQGKAILYTGDTRSEPWLVNALARSPSLLQYTQGLRTLDTLYLDTSFLENRHFQTKAEGLQELVRKVAQYPETTVFHFHAWTYGYEDVWIALSKALCSPVHVDEYKMSIYRSLMGRGPDKKSPAQYPLCSEAAALVGFQCGNRLHEGCLTLDDTVRLHSCEKGNYCKAVEKGPVVWIRPIVCRLPSGSEMQEAGIGGGGDELENIAELGRSYLARMTAKMQISLDDLLQSPAALREFVFDTFLSVDEASMAEVEGLEAFLRSVIGNLDERTSGEVTSSRLPRILLFPYSRHSSYPELKHLVGTLKPRDVWPCTAVPSDWLREGLSIEDLFGDLCAEKTFRFDRCELAPATPELPGQDESQQTAASSENEQPLATQSSSFAPGHPFQSVHNSSCNARTSQVTIKSFRETEVCRGAEPLNPGKRRRGEGGHEDEAFTNGCERDDVAHERCRPRAPDPQTSTLSIRAFNPRAVAFETMLHNVKNNVGGTIGLISTTDNHSTVEQELGERL